MSESEHPGEYPNDMPAGDAEALLCPMQLGPDPGSCFGRFCAAWVHTHPGRSRCYVFHEDPQATEEPAPRPDRVPRDWTWVPFDPAEGDPASWVQPELDAARQRRGRCGLVHLRG